MGSQSNSNEKQLLIIGFERYGSLTSNPSAELVTRLKQEDPTLWVEILPTSYRRAWIQMQALLTRGTRRILMFGYSRHASGLRLEQIARNADYSEQTDNDGELGHSRIVARGPKTLTAAADVVRLQKRLEAAKVPVTRSANAGGYVCNHVYYRTLHAARRTPIEKCLFVHVAHWEGTPNERSVLRGTRLLAKELSSSSNPSARERNDRWRR